MATIRALVVQTSPHSVWCSLFFECELKNQTRWPRGGVQNEKTHPLLFENSQNSAPLIIIDSYFDGDRRPRYPQGPLENNLWIKATGKLAFSCCVMSTTLFMIGEREKKWGQVISLKPFLYPCDQLNYLYSQPVLFFSVLDIYKHT